MEEALERYYRHFREDYPLMIAGTKPEKEIIERINHCIETNQPESEPDYDEKALCNLHGAFFMPIFSKWQVCRKFVVSLLQALTIFVTPRKR